MRRLLIVSAPLLLGAAIFQVSGCVDPGIGVPPELLAQHQNQFVMAEEPEEGLQTVADVRNALLGIVEDAISEDAHDHDHDEHAKHDHAEQGHDEHDHGEEGHDEHAKHDHTEEGHADHDHGSHDHSHSSHAELPTEPMEVVMVGTVGGLANPYKEMQPDFPFVASQAMLFVCDSGTVASIDDDHGHAPGEECAFCARHAAETSHMIATIQFVGEDGKVLPIEAQQLFDVAPLDTVVIKGTAYVNKGGMLIVDAVGLYLRK